jgi:hypothetical protein
MDNRQTVVVAKQSLHRFTSEGEVAARSSWAGDISSKDTEEGTVTL